MSVVLGSIGAVLLGLGGVVVDPDSFLALLTPSKAAIRSICY